ncbi:hypothetical protein [Streptacidiphilus neutrinimicus]|uniref:hypothetical protein n=1 Tax=Streptacidiphilus neutrinimicus TaxID=105420 RepID=UPI00137878A4|nr:hypothetical protein [Streptacidiphilus neutrinimicus]
MDSGEVDQHRVSAVLGSAMGRMSDITSGVRRTGLAVPDVHVQPGRESAWTWSGGER